MKKIGLVISLVSAFVLSVPATAQKANAQPLQSSGVTCTLVYQSAPDASGNYTRVYECSNGSTVTENCSNQDCSRVWDYREER